MKKNKFALLAGLAGVAAAGAAAAFAWLKHKSEDTYYIDITADADVLDDEPDDMDEIIDEMPHQPQTAADDPAQQTD